MFISHLLVEVFCDQQACLSKKTLKRDLKIPCNHTFRCGIGCLECPFSSYTYCPDELCLSNSSGCVDLESNSIGFGGDMMPTENEEFWIARWHEIAKKKIAEAYDEYMYEFRQGQ